MCEYSQKSLLTWRNIHIHQHFISHPPFPFLNIGKRKKIGESRSRSRIHVLIILLILKKEIIYLWLGCIKEKVHWSIIFQLTFFERKLCCEKRSTDEMEVDNRKINIEPRIWSWIFLKPLCSISKLATNYKTNLWRWPSKDLKWK